jgi:CDP-diacylglycerol--serine O-phosphatidyltransferase
MISNIPFNSFKKSEWVKRHKKRVFFIIIMLGILTAVKEQIMISLLINIYVFASLIYFIKNKGALQNMFQWKGEEDDESGDNQNDEL